MLDVLGASYLQLARQGLVPAQPPDTRAELQTLLAKNPLANSPAARVLANSLCSDVEYGRLRAAVESFQAAHKARSPAELFGLTEPNPKSAGVGLASGAALSGVAGSAPDSAAQLPAIVDPTADPGFNCLTAGWQMLSLEEQYRAETQLARRGLGELEAMAKRSTDPNPRLTEAITTQQAVVAYFEARQTACASGPGAFLERAMAQSVQAAGAGTIDPFLLDCDKSAARLEKEIAVQQAKHQDASYLKPALALNQDKREFARWFANPGTGVRIWALYQHLTDVRSSLAEAEARLEKAQKTSYLASTVPGEQRLCALLRRKVACFEAAVDPELAQAVFAFQVRSADLAELPANSPEPLALKAEIAGHAATIEWYRQNFPRGPELIARIEQAWLTAA